VALYALKRRKGKDVATKTLVSIESDLSGKSPAETVMFGWDGYQYEIDITESEKEDLATQFEYLIKVARVKGKRANGRPRPARSNLEASPSTVREWARSQGMDVPKRGRIPSEIIDKFNAADKNTTAVDSSASEDSEVSVAESKPAEEKKPRASRKKSTAAKKPVASEAQFSG